MTLTTIDEKIKWILEQHVNTNHMYDNYLPYKFHLQMVATAGEQFFNIITVNSIKYELPKRLEIVEAVTLALWGHDLIEDTRTSYNDVEKVLGKKAADLIYACTNEKGKTRAERANNKYYQGITHEEFATFIKLCDRIGNVQFSKLTKSSMFNMYKNENPKFLQNLLLTPNDIQTYRIYKPMVEYLETLFTSN